MTTPTATPISADDAAAPYATLRVLHVIGGVSFKYGGTSTYLASMASTQAKLRGLTVEIATTDADGGQGRLTRPPAEFECPVHMFPITWSERWKYSRGLAAWLAAETKRFDVVHLHGMWSHCVSAAANAARRASVPYVVSPAGMLSPYAFSRKSLFKRLYWTAIERRTALGASAFHATGAAEAAEVRALAPAARVHVVPYGVESDASDKSVDRDWLDHRVGRPRSAGPRVLYMSRLHPKKGIHDILLPAFARLAHPTAILAIAGGADDHEPAYPATIQATIERLGLGKRVVMLGEIRGDDRWRAYDGADLFVLPSRAENFGLVVAEAMCRGLPVVVTEGVQSNEHVRAADCGHIVPCDPAAVATAIDATLGDPQAAHAAGLRGQQYAVERLQWPAVATSLFGLYRDLANRR